MIVVKKMMSESAIGVCNENTYYPYEEYNQKLTYSQVC